MNRYVSFHVLTLIALLGCSSPKSSVEIVAGDEQRLPKFDSSFDSPEACFEKVQSYAADDPQRLNCLTEAARNFMMGELAFNLERFAAISDGGEMPAACRKVLAKHGLQDKNIVGFLQMVDSPIPGGAMPGFIQIGDSIRDKIAFCRDANAAVNPTPETTTNENQTSKDDVPAKAKALPRATLQNLKTNGDMATATVARNEGADTNSAPEVLVFKKENNSWLIAMSNTEPDWKKPIGGRWLFSEWIKP